MAVLDITKIGLNSINTLTGVAPAGADFEIDIVGNDAAKDSYRSIIVVKNNDTVNTAELTIKKGTGQFAANADLVKTLAIGEQVVIILETAKFKGDDGNIHININAVDLSLIEVSHLVLK